jgi:hypothetical protein
LSDNETVAVAVLTSLYRLIGYKYNMFVRLSGGKMIRASMPRFILFIIKIKYGFLPIQTISYLQITSIIKSKIGRSSPNDAGSVASFLDYLFLLKLHQPPTLNQDYFYVITCCVSTSHLLIFKITN